MSSSFEAPTLEALAELLPAYDIEAFVAQGGMGAVYKARQRSLDRDVAIKILPRELGEDPEFRQSFATEARAMARLNHPNLIGVYDSGDVAGMPYIVMEYVNGKSLYHSAYKLAVDPPQAVKIVKAICDGLAHAHENGVIHRDIKPANILLTPKTEPKIGDFGLARPAGSDGPGLIMGTPGYTAPEVMRHPEHADRRADIFAVGVILYELLTGNIPPEEGHIAPPSTVVGCDPALDRICQQAMHVNPDCRYPSAQAMSKVLEEWLHKAPVSNVPYHFPPTVRPPAPAAPRASAPVGVRRAPAPVKGIAPARTGVAAGKKKSRSGLVVARNLAITVAVIGVAAVGIMELQKSSAKKAEDEKLAAEQQRQDAEKARLNKQLAEDEAARAAAAAAAAHSAATAETPMQSLERLKPALVAGKREEMPRDSVYLGDSDVFLISTPMSWQEAADYAESYGAHLLVVASEADLKRSAALVTAGSQGLWLGAGRVGTDTWTSVDGSAWKPAAKPGGVGAYAMVDDLGVPHAHAADDKLPFIIQWQRDGANPATLSATLARTAKSLATEKPVYPPGTLSYDERFYFVVTHAATAAEADALAKEAGGHLGVPATREEAGWLADSLAGFSGREGYWLGGVRQGGAWSWVTGEKWSFTKWAAGFPKADAGDALLIQPGQGWQNADATKKATGFVIEWSKDRDTAGR